ncbi:Protein of unknown function [Cotesia congregata]|uniref:Uncharacterized protein n=1 Tax=Cotesia congregata TaxID=51543 RepID=A0A8J2HQG6_COTCN|nr:Protein of unknown function [Cotesia congregata]
MLINRETNYTNLEIIPVWIHPLEEMRAVKPLCSEEVLRVIALLEDPASDPSDDLLDPCIFALEQHSDDNSEPEQASDSEWEDEVETLCEPTELCFYHIYYKPGNGSPPEKTSRIPISVWIFGVKLQGILDAGSERSYINEKVYEDIKHLAAGELQDDQTKEGVLLAYHSTCKSRGGAPFIIQVGSVAGEQYLSVLPDLGYSLVLGMDFATKFEVQIDCKNSTWKFSDSPEVFLFQPINCHEKSAHLCAMSELQEVKLKHFLETELRKFDEVSNLGAIKIIQHEIKILEDLLYYRRPDPLKEILGDEDEWKKVLTDHKVPETLRRNHVEPDAGHLGRDKMYERIKTKFY